MLTALFTVLFIVAEVMEMFEAGKFDVAHLFFSKFKSALTQEPTRLQILNLLEPYDLAKYGFGRP